MTIIVCDVGETECHPDNTLWCCNQNQQGFSKCGTCVYGTPTLSIIVPPTFFPGQSVTASGRLFNGGTLVGIPNILVTVYFDWDSASWSGRLGALGGSATTDANGNYSVTIPAWEFVIPADTRTLPRGWSYRAVCTYCMSDVVLNTEAGTLEESVLAITSITPANPTTIQSVTVNGTLTGSNGTPLVGVAVNPMVAGPGDSGPTQLAAITTTTGGAWHFVIPANLISSKPAGTWEVGAWTDSVVLTVSGASVLYNGTVLSITDTSFIVSCYLGTGIDPSLCSSAPQPYSPDQVTTLCDGSGKHYNLQETSTCEYCYVWDNTYCGVGCVPGQTQSCANGRGGETCIVSGNGTAWGACSYGGCVEGQTYAPITCVDGTVKYTQVCRNQVLEEISPAPTCNPVCTPGQYDTSKQTLCGTDLVTYQQHSICQETTTEAGGVTFDTGNKWVAYTPPVCPACGTTHPTAACEDDGYVYDCVGGYWTKTSTPCCRTTHPGPECLNYEVWDCVGEAWADTSVACGSPPPPPVDNSLLYLAVGGTAAAIAGIAVVGLFAKGKK